MLMVVTGCSSSDGADASGSASAATSAQSSLPESPLPSFPPVPANAKMTLTTDQGVITIAMDPAAEVTDASMAYLAARGYFDNTPCHRLTTQGIYVLQCGDPDGTGRGGPGYEIPDENLPADSADNYPKGTVAMTNAGPNTNGSQFFIVYQDTTLPPNYTIWGTVEQGLDVVEKVAAAGVAGGGSDGPPALPITIQSAKVS
jgi:peptidyl-prolyl cis-trans isomerase B (cyclophilin B)